MKTKISRLAGKVIRKGAEIIIVYRVNGKYYPATPANNEVMDAYLHTGNEVYLQELEGQLE